MAENIESIDTLVIGAGQAGLATSYWLTQAGVDHMVLDRREQLGGAWLDRWDSFCLVAPNFTLMRTSPPSRSRTARSTSCSASRDSSSWPTRTPPLVSCAAFSPGLGAQHLAPGGPSTRAPATRRS